MRKRILSLLLIACLLGSLLPQFAPTASAKESVFDDNGDNTVGGICGENVRWILNLETGILRIYGEGDMYDYAFNETPFDDGDYDESCYDCHYFLPWFQTCKGRTVSPWDRYREIILECIIDEGVTSVGDDAFIRCDKMTKITLPNGITKIGWDALGHCSSLREITLPNTVKTIGHSSLPRSIQGITFSESVTNVHDGNFSGQTSLTFLNPNCVICFDGYIYDHPVIYGYDGSTAQSFAEESGCKFVSLGTNATRESGNVYEHLTKNLTLTIYANKRSIAQSSENFKLVDAASVEYNGTVYTLSSSDNGQVNFPYSGGSVTVSKDGYVSRTISEAAIKHSQSIYLQKKPDLSRNQRTLAWKC